MGNKIGYFCSFLPTLNDSPWKPAQVPTITNSTYQIFSRQPILIICKMCNNPTTWFLPCRVCDEKT